MPRLVGLGMMAGGDLATTFGLGANGLAAPGLFSRAEITLFDFPCTEITLADSGPATCITAELDEPGVVITTADAGPATTIGLSDRPATIITAADGKDG